MGWHLQYTTIVSGGTVSTPVAVANAKYLGVSFPVVTSCAAYMQAGIQVTSASNFTRVFKSDGTGYFTMAIGVGSFSVPLKDVTGFPFVRFETGVAQADTRTLTVHVVY